MKLTLREVLNGGLAEPSRCQSFAEEWQGLSTPFPEPITGGTQGLLCMYVRAIAGGDLSVNAGRCRVFHLF